MIRNDKDRLIRTRIPSKRRIRIDYRKLNSTTRDDNFPLPILNQMLDRLAGHAF